jgi:hypothetical protein
MPQAVHERAAAGFCLSGVLSAFDLPTGGASHESSVAKKEKALYAVPAPSQPIHDFHS